MIVQLRADNTSLSDEVARAGIELAATAQHLSVMQQEAVNSKLEVSRLDAKVRRLNEDVERANGEASCASAQAVDLMVEREQLEGEVGWMKMLMAELKAEKKARSAQAERAESDFRACRVELESMEKERQVVSFKICCQRYICLLDELAQKSGAYRGEMTI